PTLLCRIRAQGNFTEYVPLALIALGLCEYRGVPGVWLYTISVLLVLGRALHVAGMLSGVTPIRASGMVGTYGALLVGAAVLTFI
ncbi:MAPEG family protein, partial [Rhizobiaceae sp. 2RAB30]